ncbi:gastrula zinc finger protein XlCGF26.1-like [Ptychodera flava]|uniref:gastrula zinc finger protein XlCGF26.1-like n=1 Tax=Ptychodera flava TaxID=63121 RepID=UPI00396A8F21
MKGIHTELTTKNNNLVKNHAEFVSKSDAASSDIVASTEKAKEMPSTDIEGASNESHHPVTEGDSNKELPPQKRSKRKGPAIKIELQEKKEGKKKSKLERVEKRKKKVKKRIYNCEDCGTSFSSEQEYSLHMTQHQPEARKQTFQCRICEREFGRAMALKDHEKSEHPGERKDTKDVQGTVYQCEDCGIDFRSKREYSKHASKHRQEARKRCIQCPICGTQFDREIDLRNHEKLEHPGKRPYVCETCGASFQHSTLLRDHTKLVHRTTFFHCDLCDKIFKRKHSLKTHKDIKHLNIWKYQCDICGLKTTLKYEYMVHLLVHSKERNFTCEVCGKAFKTKRTLNGHKTSHSDKRPYSCDVCGKGFLRREHLMEHLVVHTKENTFLCEDCGKSFSNKTNLYVHRRQHTGIRPYVCTVCGQGFHRRKALGKHMEKLHSDSAAEANPSENVNA